MLNLTDEVRKYLADRRRGYEVTTRPTTTDRTRVEARVRHQ